MLAGSFWLLEDEQARVAVFRMLPDELAVFAGVPTNVSDEAEASQPKASESAPGSQASPTQLVEATDEPSRRTSPAVTRRQVGEDSKTLSSKRTLAFWKSLNRIMTKEAAMRTGNSDGNHVANRRSAEFAVTAIQGLDRRYVDVRVQALAEEIVDWYSEQLQVGTGRTMVRPVRRKPAPHSATSAAMSTSIVAAKCCEARCPTNTAARSRVCNSPYDRLPACRVTAVALGERQMRIYLS